MTKTLCSHAAAATMLVASGLGMNARDAAAATEGPATRAGEAMDLHLGAAWDQPAQPEKMADTEPRSEPAAEQAEAGVAAPESPWRVEVRTWIWLIGMDGDLGVRGFETDVNASFGDVLDASDSILAFSGRLEVGYERFGLFLDGLYADIGADDQSGPAGIAQVDVSTEQGLLDFGLMYRLFEWEPGGDAAAHPRRSSLDLYAGGRYTDIKIELDPANFDRRSGDEAWVDPIVGAKAVLPVSERWHFEVNGDIGGFGVESDFTWSATGVVGYSFELFGLPSSVFAGYRAMGWDFSSGGATDGFVWQMTQHGPILGMSVRF